MAQLTLFCASNGQISHRARFLSCSGKSVVRPHSSVLQTTFLPAPPFLCILTESCDTSVITAAQNLCYFSSCSFPALPYVWKGILTRQGAPTAEKHGEGFTHNLTCVRCARRIELAAFTILFLEQRHNTKLSSFLYILLY